MATPNRYETRRKVLAHILCAGVAGASTAIIAPRWRRPVLESVLLPAHATTSTTTVAGTPFSTCSVAPLNDGDSISFTLDEASCTPGASGVAFLTASCATGETTLTVAPGIQWAYVSGNPAGNPIVVTSGSGVTAVSFIVQQLVTGVFYSMQLTVDDDGTQCQLSDISIFGPFASAAEAT